MRRGIFLCAHSHGGLLEDTETFDILGDSDEGATTASAPRHPRRPKFRTDTYALPKRDRNPPPRHGNDDERGDHTGSCRSPYGTAAKRRRASDSDDDY